MCNSDPDRRVSVRLLFSAAWPGMFEVEDLSGSGIEVSLTRRSVDWGVSRWRQPGCGRNRVRIARESRHHDVTIVCTGGIETFLVPMLWPLFRLQRTPLVMLDPIALASNRLDRLWRGDHAPCVPGAVYTEGRHRHLRPSLRCSRRTVSVRSHARPVHQRGTAGDPRANR